MNEKGEDEFWDTMYVDLLVMFLSIFYNRNWIEPLENWFRGQNLTWYKDYVVQFYKVDTRQNLLKALDKFCCQGCQYKGAYKEDKNEPCKYKNLEPFRVAWPEFPSEKELKTQKKPLGMALKLLQSWHIIKSQSHPFL